MIEVAAVVAPGSPVALRPFSREDERELGGLVRGRAYRLEVYGIAQQRSLRQLRLFWAACREVAAHEGDTTPERVAFDVKVALRFFDEMTVAGDGAVCVSVRSISFRGLRHPDACRFFDEAFPVLAARLGVTVDELLAAARRDEWW